jgi:hypothetical protein
MAWQNEENEMPVCRGGERKKKGVVEWRREKRRGLRRLLLVCVCSLLSLLFLPHSGALCPLSSCVLCSGLLSPLAFLGLVAQIREEEREKRGPGGGGERAARGRGAQTGVDGVWWTKQFAGRSL